VPADSTRRLRSLALLVLAIGMSAPAAAAVMFKYRNADGDVVYSYTLPPGQARLGYEKVEIGTGKVLETVAAQLPPAELEARQRRERAMAECRNELERIYALYGSERDIAAAEHDAVDTLEKRIVQIQGNLARQRRELERLRGQAADAERAGNQVSGVLLDRIGSSQSQLDQLENEIAQRRREQDEARARYQRERERFQDGRCPAPEAMAQLRSED
jgi:chromosome segregation ATPase